VHSKHDGRAARVQTAEELEASLDLETALFLKRIGSSPKFVLFCKLFRQLFFDFSSSRSTMEDGTVVLFKKHAVYICVAAWHIVTHFHIVVPWILIPVIFAFRVPYIEPFVADLASIQVSKIPNCNQFGAVVQNVQVSCELWGLAPPKNYDSTTMLDAKRQAIKITCLRIIADFPPVIRCRGFLIFNSVVDADNFMNTEVILLVISRRFHMS
jgi:hypothetical protein